MTILSQSDRNEVARIFAKELGPNNVRLINIVSENGCEYCKQTNELLREIVDISNGKITLETYDLEKEKDKLSNHRVDRAPAIIISNGKSETFNVRFYGIPAGYEFRSLLDDIIDVSKGSTRLTDSVRAKIRDVSVPLTIKVFVTPSCPYCPRAVRIAHQFAMENEKIEAEMIESLEFPELAEKYSVMAVPKIVINEKVEFEGAVPENVFLWKVLEAV
jgi:glutaredoxin-like protein